LGLTDFAPGWLRITRETTELTIKLIKRQYTKHGVDQS
jgi:hypothetical protein